MHELGQAIIMAIFGLVVERYYSAPIVLLYSVGSSNNSPLNAYKTKDDAIGVLTGLASSILARVRMSSMYPFWERSISLESFNTSIPKKKIQGTQVFHCKIKL